ncbi:MAG: chorismate mutase [Acetobacteraceae bacterium]|nr:chorismate mutase [Acetobacteraceae bacterium]
MAALRAELDTIDNAIHDLLQQRAAVVEQVATQGGKGGVAIRPGREADIIRRLLARHAGHLPARLIVRWWRELFAATTSMQGSYVVAVCETEPGSPFVQSAREHFGALTPLRVHPSPSQAIAEVSAGTAISAVLPLPAEGDTTAWWTALLHRDDPRIHVIARLPFWAPRPEGAPQVQALVVAAVAPDASARDRSLIGLELHEDASRARLTAALTAAGLAPLATILRRDPAATLALVEVEGLVGETDPRLARLDGVARPPVVLGAYAVPVEGDSA